MDEIALAVVVAEGGIERRLCHHEQSQEDQDVFPRDRVRQRVVVAGHPEGPREEGHENEHRAEHGDLHDATVAGLRVEPAPVDQRGDRQGGGEHRRNPKESLPWKGASMDQARGLPEQKNDRHEDGGGERQIREGAEEEGVGP